eukprot:Gb_28886 [translate_table: standard]
MYHSPDHHTLRNFQIEWCNHLDFLGFLILRAFC